MNKLAIMSMKKKEHRNKILLRISIDQGKDLRKDENTS